jgi:hypothetical protein
MENFMKTLTALAAALTVSTLMASAASAADLRVATPTPALLRVSVANKAPAQIDADIKAAANKVCTDGRGLDAACAAEANDDAQGQLRRIISAHLAPASNPVSVSRLTPSTVRVRLDGKTPAQIDTDINSAAKLVCKEVSDGQMEYLECTKAAVSDAQRQLRSAKLELNNHRVSN